ncbi:MAG: hypothetical protein ABMA15_25320 [Vicinamibacterales bacterium]
MKRTIAVLLSVACVSVLAGSVNAQVPGTLVPQAPGTLVAGSQMMHDKNMQDETSVIGCIAQSTDMTHFMLNNAKVSDSKAKADPRTNTAMKDEAATKKHNDTPMSYTLMSADDLKSHVGHQVELTGAIVSNTSGVIHGEVKGQMPQELPRKDAASAKSDVPTFAVKSVKMIANACS